MVVEREDLGALSVASFERETRDVTGTSLKRLSSANWRADSERRILI